MGKHRKPLWLKIVATVVLLAVLSGGYVGTYFALVERTPGLGWGTAVGPPDRDGVMQLCSINSTGVRYKYCGNAAAWLFSPIHRRDKKWRPEYWGPVLYHRVNGQLVETRLRLKTRRE